MPLLRFSGATGEIRLSAQIRRNIVELAAHCALAMQGARVRMEQATGAHLEFKIGLGSGPIRLCHLGGLEGKWNLLLKARGLPKQFSLREARSLVIPLSRQIPSNGLKAMA